MKKILFVITVLVLVSAMAFSCFAAPSVSVKLNGNTLEFEQPPVIIEGRTLVPLRAIFEALGASVEWDGATKTVTSQKDDITIRLTIGANTIYRNGAGVELDVPAQIVGEGYTMVPARAIAESYGVNVGWDDATKTVLLTTDEEKKQNSSNPYANIKGIVYDFDNGDEGWKGYAKACTSTVENGHLKVTSVEGVNDPQVLKNKVDADTAKYDRLVIRFKYNNYGKDDTKCNIYFATDVTGAYNEAKNIKAFYNECYVDGEGYTWAEFALFRNENWKGTCTSIRFDPASGGNGEYLIDKIILAQNESIVAELPVQPKPVPEIKSEETKNETNKNANAGTLTPAEPAASDIVFDFNHGDEGWKGYAKASTSVAENGHLKVTSVEGVNDPQISKTGLSIDTTKYSSLVIRFKYNNYGKEDTKCNIYFASDVTGSYNEAKNIKAFYNECQVDADGYTVAEFALFRNENWKGNCTAIRFDPASGGNGEYLIDKIIVKASNAGTSSTPAAETVTPTVSPSVTHSAPAVKIKTLEDCKEATGIIFEFESGDEGWKAHTKMVTPEVSGGTLKLTSVPDANDPQVIKTGLSVSTDACKTILIKYKWNATGSANFSDLYFATSNDTKLSESKKLKGSFDSYIKDTDGYSWAVFDMSTNENWNGTCTIVRFDPIGAGNGEFIIDKIVFVTSQAEGTDVTGKKRLMLVGDSIAFEYGPHLMKMISEEYVMYEKEGREIAAENLDVAVGGNAGDSKNVVKFVKQMDSEGRFNFDMFLFNCGLHDLKRNKPDRALQVSISDYESNLREVIAICKKNNVPVVFVNITPILDTRYGEDAEFIRKNEDVIAYNAVAEKVMKENDVPVIDLNGYTLSLGQLSTTMRDHAHYYVDVQQKQAQYIADYIMK